MTAAFKEVIESIKALSADDAWVELAEKRYLEIESGAIKGVSWQKIKSEATGQDA